MWSIFRCQWCICSSSRWSHLVVKAALLTQCSSNQVPFKPYPPLLKQNNINFGIIKNQQSQNESKLNFRNVFLLNYSQITGILYLYAVCSATCSVKTVAHLGLFCKTTLLTLVTRCTVFCPALSARVSSKLNACVGSQDINIAE